MIAAVIEKMIEFYRGNYHDISHCLNVYALAKTIGEQEGLDRQTQQTLELAAAVHDITCPLCREKYGSTDGKKQEQESPALIEAFFSKLSVPAETVQRVSWLVAHHHTYGLSDDPDYQILLEADYLVNAGEKGYSAGNAEAAQERIFRTKAGKALLAAMFLKRETESRGN